MGTKFMDHTMRWILIIACVLLLCMGALLILDTVVSQQEDAPSASILSVPEQDMRIYARVQKETGIPWVVLCAIDRAEDVSPDLARARTVADVLIQAGGHRAGTDHRAHHKRGGSGRAVYHRSKEDCAHIPRDIVP